MKETNKRVKIRSSGWGEAAKKMNNFENEYTLLSP